MLHAYSITIATYISSYTYTYISMSNISNALSVAAELITKNVLSINI